MKREDELNFLWKKFGMITIISDLGRINKRRMVSAICDCGTIKTYELSTLRSGRTLSCGCLNKKLAAGRFTRHGLASHPLYKIWSSIKSRCCNIDDKSYANYGGRGVLICEEWKNDFKAFFGWSIENGWRKGLDLDKDILGDGITYAPGSCCFVSRVINSRNKRNNIRIEYNGQIRCLTEWCEILKLSYPTIISRIKRHKWDHIKALTEPIKMRKVA